METQVDPKQVANSLAQLTGGWKTGPGVAPEALSAARTALAASLIAGKTLADLHAVESAVPMPLSTQIPNDPALSAELLQIATSAAKQPAATMAFIRSAYAANVNDPSGAPAWARSAQVVRSFGPFLDLSGVSHWVDLTLFTVSTQFAFGSASSPFGVFPIVHLLLPPASAKHFALGAESVWFLANLLNSTLPAGAFTGFSITGGSLDSSAAMTLTSGVYVIPSTATLTITATLAAASSPPSTGDPGADAAAAVFTPPASVTLVFKSSSAVFQAVADATAKAYGSSIQLQWSGGEAVEASAGLTEVLVPGTPAPATFTFANVLSEVFIPSGSAPIAASGWALPLVTASIATLPAAAGPGAAMLVLKAGASLQTSILPVTPMTEWLLQIATGGLYALTGGKAAIVDTTFQLWPQAASSKFFATVDFSNNTLAVTAYLATSTSEIIYTAGQVQAHLDRPVAATGARFAYQSAAILVIDQTATGTLMAIIGARQDDTSVILPLAIENAVMGVDAPAIFTLSGALDGTTVLNCTAGFYFDLRWLLPTLPDPYAASFDLSLVATEANSPSAGTVVAGITWAGGSATPVLDFVLLPPATATGGAGTTPFPLAPVSTVATVARQQQAMGVALLDLSTRVDLFGVAVAPQIGALTTQGDRTGTTLLGPPAGSASGTATAAPSVGFQGMTLALNGADVATFALPQFSWEPMESTAAGQSGPVVCDPAFDGYPLLVASPDNQQLVPFAPAPVLLNNIANVEAGRPFAALFSLPFGLDAIVIQPNALKGTKYGSGSSFLLAGGRFGANAPRFPNAFPPSPPVAAPPKPLAPTSPPKILVGAVTLAMTPEHPEVSNASFPGFTNLDLTGAAGSYPGYGTAVLGYDPTTHATDVAQIFAGEFSQGQPTQAVPLRRIDFSGYGASTFSEWLDQNVSGPAVTKVQFGASVGRTSLEVIQVVSVIYPYCIQVVRTITMQRQNAGWIKRSDTGWQAASAGTFAFPSDVKTQYANRVHPGALNGVYNVRNIRDAAQTYSVIAPSSPPGDPEAGKTFEFREVIFDADLALDSSLKVTTGGFPANGVGGPASSSAVASQNMIGYLQLSPDLHSPFPATLALLLDQTGPLSPAISCTVEAGSFSGASGTVLRCSAFEVDIVTAPPGSSTPAVAVALRGAPQIPRGGGWSMGQRPFTQPDPSALPSDYPVPLVRPATSNDYWYIADVTDVLQVAKPANYYSLLHSTGTQKVLFESPQIPTSSTISPPPPAPGLQFLKPGPPQSGGAPANPGSPNLGDLASILNATGLFPDLSSALSLMQGAATEQINTIGQGFQYSKNYTFPAGQTATIVDLAVMNIQMLYSDTPQQTNPPTAASPTVLQYSVDSSTSPSWTLSIGKFTLQVVVPLFGSNPVLWITGGFYGDEHTAPGVTGLNIQFGGVLTVVQNVFSALQTLAQFLPGGATANLNVALSDGSLTVQDTFSIADMPLGLGNLTDISLDVGLAVQLQPLSVDFSVGIGSPDNPFNWIASPLAGNGLMNLGVAQSQPEFTIQAGIGLGLAIDLGIASGSASVTIAFQLNVDGNSLTLMVILSGQASVDVLDGLASASLTLSAALGVSLQPALPIPNLIAGPPPELQIPSIDITLLAAVSVGIHLTVCWVVSVNWDGSWQFSQSFHTPELTVSV